VSLRKSNVPENVNKTIPTIWSKTQGIILLMMDNSALLPARLAACVKTKNA
jgi:hypothetical protein